MLCSTPAGHVNILHTKSSCYNCYHRHFYVPLLLFFSISQQGPDTYHSFRFLSILLCGQPGQQSPQFGKFSFCYCCCCCCGWLLQSVVFWPRLSNRQIIIYSLEFFTTVLADNVVVWMVSTRPPTSKSSSPLSNPLITVPKEPITIGIIVTFMFHSFSIL